MEPVTMLLLASLAGSALSTGAGMAKGAKESKYQREVQSAMDAEKKKQEKDQRRAALARAIGATNTYMPQPQEQLPGAPDTTGEDIAGGIGSIGSQLASYYMANPGAANMGKLGQQGMMKGVGNYKYPVGDFNVNKFDRSIA